MSSDFWRQWQALAAPFAWNPSAAAPTGSAPPDFVSFADASERFAEALREFLGGAGGAQPSTNAASDALAAAERFSNFLRDHFAGSFRPSWSSDPAGTGQAPFSRAPALGPGREQMLRAQRAFDAWNRLTQAQGRLQRMWSDTLRNAAAAFTSRLQPASDASLTAEATARLYDSWIECAEEAYANTAHSDAFCDGLSEHVNAAADWRRESTAGIEAWAKLWDLPTRSEINTLTLRVRELDAQLASLRARAASEVACSAAPRRSPPRARVAKATPVKPNRSMKSKRPAKRRPAGSKRAP